MKAYLKLDTINHMITFKCPNLSISFAIAPRMSTISSIDEVDNGYMVIQTNYGEEYIDLLGWLELDNYDKSFIDKAEGLLKDITLGDIVLEIG